MAGGFAGGISEVLSGKKMSDIKLLENTMNDINTCRAFQKIS